MSNGPTPIMNMWSNVNDVVVMGVVAPAYANLALAYAYSVALINTTNAEIDSGTIIFEGADADPDNPCEPDVFAPLEPVADCGPIVTGVPYSTNVEYEITPERPIPAYGSCNVSVPCPRQFLQVSGLPAGVIAVVVLTRLRRWDPTPREWGYIPAPLTQPFQLLGAQQPAQAASQAQTRTTQPKPQQPQPQRRQRTPAE